MTMVVIPEWSKLYEMCIMLKQYLSLERASKTSATYLY